ncbi:hypothetical protein AMECASPLE_025228, partial [Ameca splendens]
SLRPSAGARACCHRDLTFDGPGTRQFVCHRQYLVSLLVIYLSRGWIRPSGWTFEPSRINLS